MLVNLQRFFSPPPGHTNFDNLAVRLRILDTNNPTRLYSESGTLLTKTGIATLAPNGFMDVWVTEGLRLRIELYDTRTNYVYVTRLASDPNVHNDMYIGQQVQDLYNAGLNAGTVVSPALSFSAALNGLEVTVSDLQLQYSSEATLTSQVDWGDGNPPENTTDLQTTSVPHTYEEDGVYTVKVSAKNGAVVGAAASMRVVVAVPLTFSSVGVYEDTTIVEAIPDGAFTYVGSTVDWGDGSPVETMTNSFFDLVHEYPDNGTYTFVVTEVGTGRTASIEVDVATATDLGPYPYGARGEISSTTGIATTTSIAFFDTSIVRDPPTSWLWSFGDSTTSTLQNPTHVYATAGAKNVTLAIDGGSPVAVGTVTVIAAPTWSASTVMADTFAVDGLMNNRAPTTPMVNVFDTWKAPLPSAVTLGGKYTNESTENGAPVSISQWETGDGTVVPPAQLLEWELSFDWANNTTLPFNIHNIIEASVYSILSGADQRRVAQLTWQPWVEDRWMFTLNAYPDDAGTSGSIQIARPAADVPLTIRIAFNDNKQYLFVGDQVVALAAANTPRAINNVTMQLGQKDTSNGTDKIDNLALKALT